MILLYLFAAIGVLCVVTGSALGIALVLREISSEVRVQAVRREIQRMEQVR